MSKIEKKSTMIKVRANNYSPAQHHWMALLPYEL